MDNFSETRPLIWRAFPIIIYYLIVLSHKSEANILYLGNFLGNDINSSGEEEDARQSNLAPWGGHGSFSLEQIVETIWNIFVPAPFEVHHNYSAPGNQTFSGNLNSNSTLFQNLTLPLIGWWDSWVPSQFQLNSNGSLALNQTQPNVTLSESFTELWTTWQAALPWPFPWSPPKNESMAMAPPLTIENSYDDDFEAVNGTDEFTINGNGTGGSTTNDNGTDTSQTTPLGALVSFWQTVAAYLHLPPKLVNIPSNLAQATLPDNPLSVNSWCGKYKWRFCITIGFGARKCCFPVPCPYWSETTCDPNFRRSEEEDDDDFSLVSFIRVKQEEEENDY